MGTLQAARIDLRGSIWEDESGVFVSRCETLDIMSAGQTFEEAWENTVDAIRLYVESCIHDGTLFDLMHKLSLPAGPAPSSAELTFEAKPLNGARIVQSLSFAQ